MEGKKIFLTARQNTVQDIGNLTLPLDKWLKTFIYINRYVCTVI